MIAGAGGAGLCSHRPVLLLDVLPDHGERGAADGAGEVGARPQLVGSPVVPYQVGEFLAQTGREETLLRELTNLVTATLGGKFTRRWTWLFSPLNSTSVHSKSAHTDRMISSMRVR
jgi:hypothetical protein